MPSNALVDEVADVGQDALAEFDTKKAGVDPGLQGDFKALQDSGRQICLLAEELEQSLAVGGQFVVAGQTACGANGQGERNGSSARLVAVGGLGDQVDSHRRNSDRWGRDPQWHRGGMEEPNGVVGADCGVLPGENA